MSKSLIFTDIHFGINSDKPSRQKIAADVVDEITQVCEINNIQTIFFLGDLFHHRTSIEVSTLNLADACITKLASVANLYLLQGNHDLYEKSGRSLSSTSIFSKHKAHIIAEPTEFDLNGQSVLMVPWCGDERGMTIREFVKSCNCNLSGKKYDILMGHFNLSDGIEIERAYSKIKGTLLKNENGVGSILGGDDIILDGENQAQELFTYTHPASQIYLGHIHEHQELVYGKRLFHIVGSPQMQVHDLKGLDPNRKRHGYYILDDANKSEFFEIRSAPKFVTVYASEIKNPTKETKEKLASLKGCVIKRCYDCTLDEKEQQEFDKSVVESSVLEEDSAVFVDNAGTSGSDNIVTAESVKETVYAMSKEDYLREMSTNIIKEENPDISDKDLEDKSKVLFGKLMGYYSSVVKN